MNDSPFLIEELKQFDNEKGYRMKYETVKTKLAPIISQIIVEKGKYLDELHSLIQNEETWSCLFSLEILKELKNEKSNSHLTKSKKELLESYPL